MYMIIYDVFKDILINMLLFFTIILKYAAAWINVDSIIRYSKFLRDHFLLLNDSWEYTRLTI